LLSLFVVVVFVVVVVFAVMSLFRCFLFVSDFPSHSQTLSVTELTGRSLGALLSAYYISDDAYLLTMATEVATHVFTVLSMDLDTLSIEEVAALQMELRYFAHAVRNETVAKAVCQFILY
jgi:hypothetical protein